VAANSFGSIFRITTWGESHGKAMGVVIDGCPAGLELTEEEIEEALAKRRPGTSVWVSPRKEEDKPQILSGLYEGKTTGAPLSILVWNRDADSSKYSAFKELYRPGHSNYTYEKKYGVVDERGGGRSSARETLCRVAAGAVAEKLLSYYGIKVSAFLYQMGPYTCRKEIMEDPSLIAKAKESALFFPDATLVEEVIKAIEKAKAEGDSWGGSVAFYVEKMPVGLGDPVYEKLEANLAKILLSLPASKAFEIGEGIAAASMRGSFHNDSFVMRNQQIETKSNHAGGVLGGISTGMPLFGKVVFKPPSGILKTQQTVSKEGKEVFVSLPEGSRHDPCVAIRAVPVVEACVKIVLADALLLNRAARL
jgi:chorismate synthase